LNIRRTTYPLLQDDLLRLILPVRVRFKESLTKSQLRGDLIADGPQRYRFRVFTEGVGHSLAQGTGNLGVAGLVAGLIAITHCVR